MKILILIILCLTVTPSLWAQGTSTRRDTVDCGKQFGFYVEVTRSTVEKPPVPNEKWVIGDGSPIDSDERWRPTDLDAVAPSYKFLFARRNTESDECVAQLITPFGRVFVFREAHYDPEKDLLSFVTKERDGTVFTGELQFSPLLKRVRSRAPSASVTLHVTKASLGTVRIQFEVMPYSDE